MAKIKQCKNCGVSFEITDEDLLFLKQISPEIDGEIFEIPSINECAKCAKQRRLVRRNERKLYKRKCDFSGKSIISIYSPDKPYTVYDQDIWWSDKRNSTDYGRDFDFSTSFTDQFKELLNTVPLPGVLNQRGENNKYCNHSGDLKNSYLTFGSANSEECYYSYRAIDSTYIFDSSFVNSSQYIYSSVDIEDSYMLFYSQSCKNSSRSWYLHNCSNCHHCIACVNLHDASYCIENKQYTKTEYENIMSVKLASMTIQIFEEYILHFPHSTVETFGSEKVVGSMVYNSQNILDSFMIYDSHDIKYSQDIYHDSHSCMDCFSAYGPLDKAYDSIALGINGYNVYFSYAVHPASDVYYSMYCYGNQHLFGCIGLKNKSYCIFNKQYTKEEYEIMVPKIIEHMQDTGERGEFFHPSLSPFGYNETVASEHFPLTREEALARGYKRQDKEYPINVPEGMETIEAKDLPESIDNVDDTILKKAIICEVSGKPFRIIKPELVFYRKHKLPLPRKHPDVRHAERLAKRPGRSLYLRRCDKCGVEMVSVYKEDNQKQKIYCTDCYRREAYG